MSLRDFSLLRCVSIFLFTWRLPLLVSASGMHGYRSSSHSSVDIDVVQKQIPFLESSPTVHQIHSTSRFGDTSSECTNPKETKMQQPVQQRVQQRVQKPMQQPRMRQRRRRMQCPRMNHMSKKCPK